MTSYIGSAPFDVSRSPTRITPEFAKQISEQIRSITSDDLGEESMASASPENALWREAPVLAPGKKTRSDITKSSDTATLNEMLGAQSEQELYANLGTIVSMLDSRRQKGEALLKDSDGAQEASESAIAEFADAIKLLIEAQTLLQVKESKLEQARDQLKQLQMQGKPESDLDHQMALTAAHKKLNSAQYEVDRAQMVVGQAEEKGYQKEQNAMAMQQVASRSMAALNSVAEQPGGVTLRSAAMQQSEKLLNNGAVLSLVLAKFIQSVGDNLVTKLEGDLEISNAMQEANKNDMLKKADEYEEQQRKAEEANKMTSCLGNIIGGIATAVGAIGMVFGGAGAGLMAVGIGLMVLDPIVEAVAGKSLTGMVLNPVIEHVFMPLMNVMSEILDKLIEYTPLGLLLEGLDKLTGLDITDTVKALASAAAAVAVFIAVAYVAKSAAKTVLDKMPKIVTEAVSQALKDTLQHVSNAVPNMVKNGSKKVGQTVSQLHKAVFKNDPLSQEKWINRMQLAHNTTMATGVVTQATGGVITGQLQKAAMDTLGGLTITSAQLEILKQLSEMVIESFEQKQQLIQQMWGEMHQQLVHRSDTGRAIMHNLRSSV